MYFIDVSDSQSVLSLEEVFLREVVEQTLEAEQVLSAEISLAIVDNPMIRELNIRYLEHDYDTDVLSFLFDSEGGDEQEARAAERAGLEGRPRGAGKRIEGELIVSAEMANDQAQEFAWNPRDELVLYIVHGLLHLTGYDDQSPTEKRIMRRREREILAIWGLTPHYADEPDPGPPAPEVQA